MASRKGWIKYRTMGAVALDAYYASAAKPLPKEEQETRPARHPQSVPQREEGISLFVLFGGAVCAFFLLLTFFGGGQVADLDNRVNQMQETVSALETERDSLQTRFDSTVNLDEIAIQARLMGMHGPEQSQHIAVSVPQPEVLAESDETTENPFLLAMQAIADTTKSLMEYLRAD